MTLEHMASTGSASAFVVGASPLPNITVDTSNIIPFLATCLFLTILIELLFSLVFRVRKKNLFIVVLAQIVTNPLVVLVSNLVYYLSGLNYAGFLISLAFLELLAFLVEGLIYKTFFRDYSYLKPFVLSLLLNLFSLIIGNAILRICSAIF